MDVGRDGHISRQQKELPISRSDPLWSSSLQWIPRPDGRSHPIFGKRIETEDAAEAATGDWVAEIRWDLESSKGREQRP